MLVGEEVMRIDQSIWFAHRFSSCTRDQFPGQVTELSTGGEGEWGCDAEGSTVDIGGGMWGRQVWMYSCFHSHCYCVQYSGWSTWYKIWARFMVRGFKVALLSS